MKMDRMKMAKIATLSAVIASGVLAFAGPYNAHASSGGSKNKSCYLTYYSNGDTKVSCEQSGSECAVAADCRGCW